MSFVIEREKRVPVVYDVDVVVAGAGVSGIFASLAAAREGAKAVLVDRFGSVGGNIGPGMIVGGSLDDEAKATLRDGLVGIPKQFVERAYALRGGSPSIAQGASPRIFHNYADVSNVASYVALKMMEEIGVQPMLSTYVADPIVEDARVSGVFVENKSGRQAVKAKVVVDATGDASIAARAGAPILRCTPADPLWDPIIQPSRLDPEYPLWDEMGLYFRIGGVDWEQYNNFKKEDYALSKEDVSWVKDTVKRDPDQYPKALIPVLRKAWMRGEYRIVHCTDRMRIGPIGLNFGHDADGLTGTRVVASGEINSGDGTQVSKLEAQLRAYIFETVQFLRKYMPGFEHAYLLTVSPYLGARGGPCIEGVHTLTPEDLREGRRFDDVLYVYYLEATIGRGASEGCDIPYRILLPKKIDGLLVTGRGAAYIRRGHDPCIRARPNLMVLGQATGTAAALAVQEHVIPRNVEVKALQRSLLKEGFYLGDETRLRELGLSTR